jgi:hypothetical protein
VAKARIPLQLEDAEAIARLSALESMREQARQGRRLATLTNIEKLIEAELRGLQRRRERSKDDRDHPQG